MKFTDSDMHKFTREDISKVMNEVKRRLDMDIKEGVVPQKARYIREELAMRMQGVYGTIMVLVTNRDWQTITWWLEEELEGLYKYYGLGELFN